MKSYSDSFSIIVAIIHWFILHFFYYFAFLLCLSYIFKFSWYDFIIFITQVLF